MTESQLGQALFWAYLQSRPLVVEELLAVAQPQLSRPEHTAFRQFLTGQGGYNPTVPEQMPHLRSACEKMITHFQNQARAPPARKHSLSELLYLAETARKSGPAGEGWSALNEDLRSGIALIKADPLHRVAQRNVARVIDYLYRRPVADVSGHYALSKPIEHIADLYYLTERQIGDFAYRFRIRCGVKTLQRLNDILTAKQLPALHNVVHDTK